MYLQIELLLGSIYCSYRLHHVDRAEATMVGGVESSGKQVAIVTCYYPLHNGCIWRGLFDEYAYVLDRTSVVQEVFQRV